jgi:amino acid transporter
MTDSDVTDADAAQLRALGYTPQFDRSMSIWDNFALGFTYLSPVVGVYTIFAGAFAAGGPPMWWSYLLVGVGQLMVCLVFGEVVSQFPKSGGLYPWARRLVGRRWVGSGALSRLSPRTHMPTAAPLASISHSR